MPLKIHVKRYINHTTPNKGRSATLTSSSTVDPTNPSPVITQIYTVPFVAMNKSVENFDRLDHQYIPAENVHQSDANMNFKKKRTTSQSLSF